MTITKYLFIALVSTLIMTSCGSEEEDTILGKWQLVDLSTAGCVDASLTDALFNKTDEGLCLMESGAGVCLDLCITFKADGTVDLSTTFAFTGLGLDFGDTITETGTWSENGNRIEICQEDGECHTIDKSGSGSINFSEYQDDIDCTVSWVLEKQ